MKIVRLFKIARVTLRYGLDRLLLEHAMTQGGWARLLTWVQPLFFWRGAESLSGPRGERLRLTLEALGPIFVKFGQVLSTRRDLLAQDIADELAKLQDQVAPFPWGVALAGSGAGDRIARLRVAAVGR